MPRIYALRTVSYRLGRWAGAIGAGLAAPSGAGYVPGETRAGGSTMTLSRKTGSETPAVTPAELRAMLKDGGEIALLDVREEGVFSEQGHPFFANSLPLSRLELLIRDLVPRQRTRMVVYDGGDEDLAERAAATLTRMGYREPEIMPGGARDGAAAGYELFTGVNVPSKAFGELVEHRCETPHIGAAELKQRLDAGAKVLIVDSRPIGEFRNMSIPGAFDCPGAELVYRVPDRVPSSDTLVVVNCAGRTRSIIGAQSLRNARLPNPVLALENGTMGWELAGLELARGREEALPAPSPEGLKRAQALADKVAERFAIRRIDDAALLRFQAQAEERTLYLFDVRSPEEYIAGHFAGSRSAPGGQLVQATDAYMPTRRVLVLTSPDAALARLAAAELEDSGFAEIRVLDGGTAAWRAAGLPLTTGREAMADTPDDCWRRPYDPYAPPDARERYLRWEIELIRQIEREGDTGFRVSA